MNINTQEIGERVHQLRTDRHLTLSTLAEELHCSRDHLSKVENANAGRLRPDNPVA
ncbi:helix-turn-helix domain-containing protein [Galactobacillus timonensis]|uniref:helix-turn-helix domain-containing protein n=1 Tax=Galactobacillus timonensis TaxID=2041840 RepID=UPI000C857EE6|nr:helix-turn-helix transcriptional regulator [Galactobacillus timonensis]